jgi:hypothetical protein
LRQQEITTTTLRFAPAVHRPELNTEQPPALSITSRRCALQTATIPVFSDEGDPDEAWQSTEGVSLSTTARNDGGRDLVVLEANGLIVDLQYVDGVFDALDARSQDHAHLIPLFGRSRPFGVLDLASNLEEKLEPGGNQVAIIDRIWVGPAWRTWWRGLAADRPAAALGV